MVMAATKKGNRVAVDATSLSDHATDHSDENISDTQKTPEPITSPGVLTDGFRGVELVCSCFGNAFDDGLFAFFSLAAPVALRHTLRSDIDLIWVHMHRFSELLR